MNSPASGLATFSPPPFCKDLDLTATVVICTRNRPAFLRKCLEAVTAQNRLADEILVVDNTQGDAETEAVAREFCARYVAEPIAGLSYARNRGLAEATGDIVAYIDDDAVAYEDWLGRLLEPFEDQQVAAVTGKIVTPGAPVDTSTQNPRVVNDKTPYWFEIATFGGLGRGGNMALRRSSCAGWTAFDERLGRGAPFHIAEENYAFASLLTLGYTAVYVPSAVVTHPLRTRPSVEVQARNSLSYWLLLFSEFPARRYELVRFLYRRLRRKPLEWPRDSQDPGDIVASGWRVQFKAALSALWLFLRTKKPKRK